MPLFGGGTGGGSLGTGVVFSLHDQFSGTADRINAKFHQLDATTSRASQNISRSLNRMKLGFAGMVAGAAMLMPLVGATSTAMEFSSVMSDVAAKANATEQQLSSLSNEALRLGEATKFSAKEVAEGQTYLAMAGYKTNQIVEAMPGMLNMAAAGNLDLATASDIASNVLTQFNMEASRTIDVADQLAYAAVSSNQSVGELAEAMKYMGPTAAAYGMDLAEATATTMSLAGSGLKGGRATRAFANSLARLSDPTDKAQKSMDKLGVSFFNAKGEFIGINNVIRKLEETTKDYTQQEKMKALASIFRSGSIKQVTALMNTQATVMKEGKEVTLQGAEALDYYTEQLEKSGGTAERVSDRLLDNLKGDITIMQSAMETASIKVGQTVEPMLRPLVQGFTALVAVFGRMAQHPVLKWVIRFMGIMGSLLLITGLTVVMINLASFAAGKAAIAFASMGKQQIAAAFASKGLAGGLRALTASLWSALAPLWPWLVAGAAIVGLFIAIKKSVSAFTDVLEGKAEPAAEGWLNILQRVGGVIKGAIAVWRSATNEGFTLSKQMQTALESVGVLDFVVDLGTWIVRIKEFFRGLWAGVKETYGILQTMFSYVFEAFDALGKALSAIGLDFRKNQSDLSQWAEIGKTIGYIIGSIMVIAVVELTIALWNMAAAVIGATWPVLLIIAAIAALAYGIYELVTNWDQIMEWISGRWTAFVEWIGGIWDEFVGWLFSLPEQFFQWGVNFVMNIWEGIKSVWDKMKNWFSDMVDNLVQPFRSALEWAGIVDDAEANVNVNTSQEPNSPTQMGRIYANNAAANRGGSTERYYHTQTNERVKSTQLVLPDGRILADVVNEENDMSEQRQNG